MSRCGIIVGCLKFPTHAPTFAHMYQPDIRTVAVTRYVTPLREGGSLPAIAEADDGFLYALKFRGAGQGVKALIAEFIGGQLAMALKLKTPEIVFATLDEAFGRTEPDVEIQDLLKASTGLNLALHYLSGSISFDVAVSQPEALLASKIVWLDALLLNVDRTVRNTNMLTWQKELWLIDHGASLYFHHAFTDWESYITKPFVQIKDHVLLPFASQLKEADEYGKQQLTPQVIDNIVSILPDAWLQWPDVNLSADELRNVYKTFLNSRIAQSEIFVNHAIHAR